MWLKKEENNQRENILKYKIHKNRYIKIHKIYLATKVLVPNDEDPFAKKVRTQELKWVRNIEMLRRRLRRSIGTLMKKNIEKNPTRGHQTLRSW